MAATVLGQADVLFTGVDDGVAKAARDSSNALSRFGGAALGALGGIATAASAAALAIAGIGAVGLGAGIKMAADLEQTTVAFEVLFGSAEAAKVLLEDLTNFAATTPFEMPGIEASARQLAAFGFGADQIVPLLRNLGDIAAGTGSELIDLAQIYGRVRVAGRAGMEDINRLSDRGVPIMTALAAQLGVTEGEVRKLVEQGKVGFPEFAAALASLTAEGGMFENMMGRQSVTVNGLISTLKDGLGLTLRDIGVAFLRAFNVGDTLADAIAFVDSVRGSVVAVATSVFDFIAGPLAGVLDWIWTAMADAGAFFTFIGASIESIPAIFDYVGASAVAWISGMGDRIVWFFGELIPGLLGWFADNWREIFTDIFTFTGTVMVNIGKNVWNLFEAIASWLAGDGFAWEWTGLTEGFRTAIRELPQIAEMEKSALTLAAEQLATEAGQKIAGNYADAFKEHADRNRPKTERTERSVEEVLAEINAGKQTAAAKVGPGGGNQQVRTGLVEAFARIQDSILKGDGEKRQTVALEKIAANTGKMVEEQAATNDQIELMGAGYGD